MREIRSLTGLRFVAAFSVLIAHVWALEKPFGLAPMTLFFCLSGFVLTWTYPGRVDVGRYALARFARVYPLYVALLAVDALLTGIDSQTSADLLLAQAWQDKGAMDAHLGPAWSLSVEAFLYATFPLVCAVLAGRSRQLLCAVALASLMWSLGFGLWGSEVQARFFPPARLGDFVFGCAMARLALSGVRLPTRVAPLCALAIAVVMAVPSGALSYDFAYLLPTGLLLLALVDARGLLAHPAMARLGVASFALYLCHFPLVEAMQSVAWHTPQKIGLMLGSVALSLALYAWVEEPARRWIRRRSEAGVVVRQHRRPGEVVVVDGNLV